MIMVVCGEIIASYIIMDVTAFIQIGRQRYQELLSQ